MNALVTALYVIVGIVNLLPVGGVLSTDRLEALYGVSLPDPNLVVLMRHRAVLFAIVGALLVGAAFHPPYRPAAIAAGLVSMLSFVVVAHLVGGINPELRRVVVVDVVASLLLGVAGVLSFWPGLRPVA